MKKLSSYNDQCHKYNIQLNKYYQAQEAIIKRKDSLEAIIWPIIRRLHSQPYNNHKDQLTDMIKIGELAKEALTVWSVQEQLNDIRPIRPIREEINKIKLS